MGVFRPTGVIYQDSHDQVANYCDLFPSAYCGLRQGDAVGAISLTLSGSGTATVVFGNPYPGYNNTGYEINCGGDCHGENVTNGGTVKLSLDTTEIASLSANTNPQEATFVFTDGQVMKIEEIDTAIILFYSISF